MNTNDKFKNGNSLETQFWSDEVKIDSSSPLTKLANKLWNAKDYVPTEEEKKQFDRDMEEYHKKTPNIKN